jgi:Ankyrin repeats (3 copies)
MNINNVIKQCESGDSSQLRKVLKHSSPVEINYIGRRIADAVLLRRKERDDILKIVVKKMTSHPGDIIILNAFCFKGNFEMVKKLVLEYGYIPDEISLYRACDSQSVECVEFLLQHKYDSTVLLYACQEGYKKIVDRLKYLIPVTEHCFVNTNSDIIESLLEVSNLWFPLTKKLDKNRSSIMEAKQRLETRKQNTLKYIIITYDFPREIKLHIHRFLFF